ncbi:MAG: glycosyl hydrolase family 28-related protein [Candidatus Flemingibacterium sp.]|nr:glycosyl hydrolase family 28-related protein [Candidatus Flemingibacterium sp.]
MDEIKLWKDGIHDDTAALQALLDKRGEVRVPDGRYLISKPLIIHDDTHLIVARNAVLRLADHVNCSLLDNDGLYERRVNRNITIEGGIWDGNNAAQEREWIPVEDLPCDYDKYISNSLIVLMIRLVHTEHLVVRDIILRDPTSYGIHIADARYFTVENVHFDYDLSKPNMDGVHIQGPARFGVIRNIMGDCNDDHVALCANGTTRSEITRGDIEDIDIDGIFCENGYTGIRLLSRGDAVRNINIRNVHGAFRLFAVSFTHHYPLHEDKPVLLENIHLSDLYVSKSTGYAPEDQIPAVINNSLVWFESGTNCRNITVERVYRHEKNEMTKAPAIRISRGATVSDMTISDIHQDFVGDPQPILSNESTSEVIIR